MKAKLPAKRALPIIRIFISSTFADLKPERDALQERVWPKLEQYCERRGFQFQAIDLRWAISTEAVLDHRVMQICFDEIRRSQEVSPGVNFLALLGNRYGWRPLPEEITVEEFRRLDLAATQLDVFGQQQPMVAVLRRWYRLDENSRTPVYVLQPRLNSNSGEPDGRDYATASTWHEVAEVLWQIINSAFPASDLRDRFTKQSSINTALPSLVRFQASNVEQEIWQGLFRTSNPEHHTLAFFREIAPLQNVEDISLLRTFFDVADGEIDLIAQDAQRELKQAIKDRLGENAVTLKPDARLAISTDEFGKLTATVSTDHIDELCHEVEARLTALIERQVNNYWHEPQSSENVTSEQSPERWTTRELEIEQNEHFRFGRALGPTETFVGRQDQLDRILDYLHNDSPWPLVIHGASGCGKTALLAQAAQMSAELPICRDQKPIVRFIGVTPRSSDLRSLLTSLCQDLRQRNPIEGALPTDIRMLINEFHLHFRAATADTPIILFLDALDQLLSLEALDHISDEETGRRLPWIPVSPLPNHVRFIVSCPSDRDEYDPVGKPFGALLRRKLPSDNVLHLDALSWEESQTLLFNRWLPAVERTVNKPQRHVIEQRLYSETCRQPLYLKLLFEEVKLWRSYNTPTEPGDGVAALLKQLFDRLSKEQNHGHLLVEYALGYVALARHGLSESELLEVLFNDPDYKRQLLEVCYRNGHRLPDTTRRIPIAIWARLRAAISPYLTNGTNVLAFYHHGVTEWIRSYFSGDIFIRLHGRLARYFQYRIMEYGYSETKALRSIPFHACIGNENSLWVDVMTDFGYLNAVVQQIDVTVGDDGKGNEIPMHEGYFLISDELRRWLVREDATEEASKFIHPLSMVWEQHASDFIMASEKVMPTLFKELTKPKDTYDRAARKMVAIVDPSIVTWCEKERQRHENPAAPWIVTEPPEPSNTESGYIFISYKREDLPKIVKFMHRIVSMGFPIWYDRGIPGAAEWDALIEEKVAHCELLLVFLSHAAVESKWVRREIKFADSENRPILGVRLENDLELKHGLKVVMNQFQMIDASDADFSGEFDKAMKYVRLL